MPVTVSTEVGGTDLRPAASPRSSRGSTRTAAWSPSAPRSTIPTARSTPASSCGCGSSCRRGADVIALPQTVLSSTLYGDSVFVVRHRGRGRRGEADGRAGLRQGRPPLAAAWSRSPRALKPGDEVVTAGPEPAVRAARAVTIDNTRQSRRPRRGRSELGRRRCISPSSSSAGRCCRRCSPPSSCCSAFQGIFNLPVRQYPEVEETVITITTVYPGASAGPDPGLHHRADRRGGRDDREHRLRHLAVDALGQRRQRAT